jgi:carbamoyl-phosphate synthase large subunit
MIARVLLTSAGNAPSNNTARSLRAGSASVFIVGCNSDQFVLKKSAADRNYVIPPAGHPRWVRSLQHIVETEAIQLILPTVDDDVAALSRARKRLDRQLFLPGAALLETCQDKYRLIVHLRDHGIAAPATLPVEDLKGVAAIFKRLGPRRPLWCRVRTGAGALGALPVRTPEQARSWIRYWNEMRGVAVDSFILSEFLPGRDFGCQSLWKDGALVLIKTYERLSYLGTGSRPAQVSSVAALAKTVRAPSVVDVCTKAIKLLDPHASGVFSVDLKEDAEGRPCITEINAGRFSSATNIFDLAGEHNMAAMFVRLAAGERIALRQTYDAAEDWYMLRDIDSPPRMFHVSEFFDNVQDACALSCHDGKARRMSDGKLHDQRIEALRPHLHPDRGHRQEPENAGTAARLQDRVGQV